MGFLTNRNVNYLNLHHALVAVLDQSTLLFMPLFLYHQGFSLTAVFLVIGFLGALRIPLRSLSFFLVRNWGLKPALMAGIAGYGLSFPLLAMVKGIDGWLLGYVVMYGMFNAVHWHCFHTFYTMAGEKEKRGRQVAVAHALGTVLAAIAPLVSALAIAGFGFRSYFFLSIPLTLCMLIVISRCANIPLPAMGWKEAKPLVLNIGAKIHLFQSAIGFLLVSPWVFILYLYVGKITTFGGLVAFGVIVQALWQLILGSLVDRGRGTLITHISGGLYVLGACGRALIPLSMPAVIGLEALSAANDAHYQAVQPTVMYNAGQESACPFWYWFFAETAYDIGSAIAAFLAALLLWNGFPLRHIILLALPAIGAVWWLIHRYYRDHAYVQPLA